jgi:hypothetical protein
MFNFLGVLLLAIWVLSPIRGHTSIRQISIGTKVLTQPASFKFMVHNGNVGDRVSSDRALALESTNAPYVGALLTLFTTKSPPRENWGNVKIPKIEYYEKVSVPDNEG